MTDDHLAGQTGPWEHNFAERMAELREAKGMTQTDLARALRDRHGLRFHQQIVARIEAGERPVRLNEAHLIAQVLETNLSAMTAVTGSTDSLRMAMQLAQGRLDAAAAGLVVFFDDRAEELPALTDELEKAWAAYTSAQKDYGVEAGDKLVHKGLALTLHRFEEAFTDARDRLADVVDLQER
jgi:transcriptional regulator with XRE-family HTH domain